MPKPQLSNEDYRFFLTKKGKKKYEDTLLKVHKKYLPKIECEMINSSNLGHIVYEDDCQVVVKNTI